MRIVGGRFSGRTLHAPSGQSVRPTSDRVRESLFNILEHGDYPLEGARVIDLFAGSGALGLEAISRGAVYALFVEEGTAPRAAIRRNIESLALTGATRIFRRDATKLGAIPAGITPFDLAFVDPPYDRGLVVPCLQALQEGGWLETHAALVVETRDNETLDLPAEFILIDERVYGETKLWFLKLR
ncbi:MAG TPA: 16S rRNA (guanine(966)-N(2))-methyltransferase RsmD [Alphaproteobacteria bacterium]|nr:16S rRNA (guanine(966)-N(2))-methyltransferase RsmD [Alphaproteobacteria bacterium]